jgi:hypothetical protein
MGELVVGSAGRRMQMAPRGSHPGPWSMAKPPSKREDGAELFLPRKLASEMVLGTFTPGIQRQLLQGELGLDVWFGRWAQK